MGMRSLKTRLILSFLAVIAVVSALIALLGFYVIKKDILDRAQQRVADSLNAARSVYEAEIDRIGEFVELVPHGESLDDFQTAFGLDYLVRMDAEAAQDATSEIVRKAYSTAAAAQGTRLIPEGELTVIAPNVLERTKIAIRETPRARPTDMDVLRSAMAKEYAKPILNSKGGVQAVLYGGRIINQDYRLVDRIRELVFGKERYANKPVGTVTIFQDDVRVATNVLTEAGRRAIGTRVSAVVYNEVVGRGRIWHDRAFVVNDWYVTAYEPIRTIHGDIIGVLYVGMLEQPFTDMLQRIVFWFFVIVALATALAATLAVILANGIARPIVDMVSATRQVGEGSYSVNVPAQKNIEELNVLGKAFEEMAMRLDEREQSLRISNEKLAASNQSYVELISFVAHELNGILGSAIMNTYAVRDGFLGMINFKQRKAIESVARNLDYLAATVKKFLNLGRIERGQLPVNKSEICLKKDVIDVCVDALQVVAQRKNIEVAVDVDPDLKLQADADLLNVVMNNLVSNAIKYGLEDSQVQVRGHALNGSVEVEVYNDGTPISDEQTDQLFKRFSRLQRDDTKRVKGNGLGLYITKNIVESHGGRIWVEARENGNSFIFQVERD